VWPLALLLLEYLGLSLLIDARDLVRRFPTLHGLPLGGVGTFLVAACTATLLAGRGALLDALRASVRSPWRQPGLLALHGASYATFLGLSAWLARPGPDASLLWLGGWTLLGLTLPSTIVLVALPLADLRRAGRRLLPFVVLGLAVGALAWAAAYGSGHLWDGLRSATFHAVAGVLGLVYPDVTQEPSTALLGLRGFRVTVAPECSGVEGLGLVTIFLAAYLWFARKSLRFPAAWALLPVGVALVLASNVVRIAALLMVGAHVSEELAVGGFHSKAGWVLFCGIALGLVALSQRTLLVETDDTSEGDGASAATGQPTAAYLLPLLALIGTHLVTGLATTQGDVLYALGILAACAALVAYRGDYAHEPWTGSWQAALAGLLCGVGWVAFAVWTRDPTAEAPQPPQLAGLAWVAWVAFRVAGSAIVVPVVEELAFRGYLLRRIIDREFSKVPYTQRHWLALALSSAAFGALHSLWVAGIAAGALFALVVWRRGRLADGVLAHMVANAVVAAYVLIWGDWALW
jgi:exosortase E/protease (VPEID-CTERM system)